MSAADRISRRSLLTGSASAGLALSVPLAARTREPRALSWLGIVDRGTPAFLGIRYARAARFAPPVREPLPTASTRADRFGPLAPQVRPITPDISEDCLFLNIWTPEARAGAARPVMVYFHGGAYNWGSVTDPVTHGPHLAAREDVVVVTVNHRLNVFGYGWLAPFGERFRDSGNLGQLDLVCALEWIRDHIGAFGGDPARVMVFGQSGGGAKIATLMAMPAAEGLFASAATMSGQQVTAQGPGNAWKRTKAFMEHIGLAGGDVESLLGLPAERLLDGLEARDPLLGGGIYFGPTLDMTNLRRHPFWPDAAPQSRHIPMILGNTTDETRAFISPTGPVVTGLDWTNIADRLGPQIRIDLNPQWVVDQYRARFPGWTAEEVFYAASTDGRSWPGQLIEADERAKAGAEKTWVYQLDRESPIDPNRGAAHTDDLPYVFGTLDAEGSFSGTGQRAREISSAMMGAFAGLARHGVPGLPDWRPYRLPERATLMVAEDRIAVENDPRGWQRQLWSRAPYIQPGS
ncbi:carboxylesterase/lipase family protein [Tsuneonella sp. SYSU-LHT278]|uniref:carboxylesterase/lipase family protein n=1 Tax=Tsuneonella sediminis TaxID=3416089 RepID=UPI003F78D1BF